MKRETVGVCNLKTAGLDALTELLILVSCLCQNKNGSVADKVPGMFLPSG